MIQNNQIDKPEFFSQTLMVRMLIGAFIGLGVISAFVFAETHPKPEWGTFWRVRPLIVTPFFGALCGAGYHVVNRLLYRQKVLAVILGILGCIVGMWMGIVLGLDGTLWD